jgi:hypothetical protein
MSSKQFREFARECMQWAEEASSEQDRLHFLEMAKAWIHAAAELGEPIHDYAAQAPPRNRKRKDRNSDVRR